MPPPSSASFSAATIPVIDMNDFHDATKRKDFCKALVEAMHTTGFVAVVNSTVNPEIMDRAYLAAQSFFAQDLATKMQSHVRSLNGQRGYVPGEQAKDKEKKDPKEFLHIAPETSPEVRAEYGYPENIWPADKEFKSAIQDLTKELMPYASCLMQALAEGLDLPIDFFDSMTRDGDNLLRVLHYPPQPVDTVVAAEHTDISGCTILTPATAAGLQLRLENGEWIDVTVPPKCFVFQMGDKFANVTNGYLKSAWHRVLSKSATESRYSMPFFVHPRPHDRMDPLPQFVEANGKRCYPNVTSREMLAERLIDLGLASRPMLEFFKNSGAQTRYEEVGRASTRVAERVALLAEPVLGSPAAAAAAAAIDYTPDEIDDPATDYGQVRQPRKRFRDA